MTDSQNTPFFRYEEKFTRSVSEQFRLFENEEHIATIYCSEKNIKKIVERLNK